MCDGHTYEQLPHEKQSITPSLAAPSSLSLRIKAAISNGDKPHGQTVTQLPQRMQFSVGRSLISSAVSAKMPEVPLTTCTSRLGNGDPIIGPPLTTLSGRSAKPPQNSIRSETLAPIGTNTLLGSRIAPPLTVTTRATSGRPKLIA